MPKFCSAPFYMLDIRVDGSCWICCEQWLPKSIGNLYYNSLDEIWNGQTAREIRQSILDQNFKFCDNKQCPALASDMLDIITNISDEQRQQVLDRKVPNDTDIKVTSSFSTDIITYFLQNDLPSQINLSYDRSCNLQCPSCRSDVININEGTEYLRIKQLHDDVIKTLFDKPHDKKITLNITGSGDPFASKIFRDFLFEFDPTPWPNLRLGIQTHGGLLTKVNWERIKHWHNRIEFIKICFDAATKSTYEIIRKRGNWDQLMSNCEFLNEKLKDSSMFAVADFVVQDQNFKEMKDFVKIFLEKFNNFSYICFYVVNNWGTWNDDEYAQRAVWKNDHPQHQELLTVLADEIFDHPKVILGSFDKMRQFRKDTFKISFSQQL